MLSDWHVLARPQRPRIGEYLAELVPSLVGDRETEDCYHFPTDLRSRIRVGNRIQLSTDGLRCYQPVADALWRNGIDYGIVVKEYGVTGNDHRYSPATCKSIKKHALNGRPDEAKISTSYVERQNLSMRMGMRRFTRLTNGFSKKIENHIHAVTLFYMHYNFCRVHQSLRVTPAMEAGITDHVWTIEEMLERMGF